MEIKKNLEGIASIESLLPKTELGLTSLDKTK